MATIGYGAKIQVADGISAAYADFEDVYQITVPVQEMASVESTHLESANRFREYVSGLIEPGEASFEQRWSDAEYDRVLGLRGDTLNYKIIFPDTSSAVFAGFITKSEIDIQTDQVVNIKNSLKVTGPVTYTAVP